jgi:riboflavin biosynthesis pyrimidine reductase
MSGGAGLAAVAVELGLVDELCMFRKPVIVGGGHEAAAVGEHRQTKGRVG